MLRKLPYNIRPVILGPDSNTFTYVSAAHGSTSWLDHCLCSPSLHSTICGISVIYDVSVDDHLPLVIQCSIGPTNTAEPESTAAQSPRLQWNLSTIDEISEYNHLIHEQFWMLHSTTLRTLHSECTGACMQTAHIAQLNECYSHLSGTIMLAGSHCIKRSPTGHPKSLPGWNLSVKRKHFVARQSFLTWRSCGSPREGLEASLMRQSRLSFKYALRKCKRNSNAAKANKIAKFLSHQQPSRFWSIIKRELGGRPPIPPSLGNISGSDKVAAMWKNHFASMFNDQSCSSDDDFLNLLTRDQASCVPPICLEDLCGAVSKLKSGKAPG